MSKAINVALFGLVAFVVVAQSQPLSNDLFEINEISNELGGGESSAVEVSDDVVPKNYIREKRRILICLDFLQKLMGLPPCGHVPQQQPKKTMVVGTRNQVGNKGIEKPSSSKPEKHSEPSKQSTSTEEMTTNPTIQYRSFD